MSERYDNQKQQSRDLVNSLQERMEKANLRGKLATEEAKSFHKLDTIADKLKRGENVRNLQLQIWLCGEEYCQVVCEIRPLHEAIKHDETGRLVNFFDQNALAASVIELLEDEDARMRLGKAARAFAIENYDLVNHCLPRQIEWLLN